MLSDEECFGACPIIVVCLLLFVILNINWNCLEICINYVFSMGFLDKKNKTYFVYLYVKILFNLTKSYVFIKGFCYYFAYRYKNRTEFFSIYFQFN